MDPAFVHCGRSGCVDEGSISTLASTIVAMGRKEGQGISLAIKIHMSLLLRFHLQKQITKLHLTSKGGQGAVLPRSGKENNQKFVK